MRPAGPLRWPRATSALPGWQLDKERHGVATYHCSVKVGGRGKAAAHAAYIAREGQYSGRARYEDMESAGHGNMPAWAAHNPAHLWSAADEHERKNGATYREIEVALPRELNPEQRRELVEDFIRQELGERHAYQWAIHTPKAALEGGDQPHAHIMYSERTLDGIERDPAQYFKRYNAKNPERGGCRKDSAGTVDRLQATRERWASIQNEHLARHGHAARVDHRSLADQGSDRLPERHLGGRGVRRLQETDISALLERRAAEGELERAQQQVSSIIDLSGDLAAALAERDQRAEQAQEAEKARQATLVAQEAEKARQEAQEAAWQQELARVQQEEERERQLRRITAEIQLLRPQPVHELVERDPAVIRAEQECDALARRHTEAQAREAKAQKDVAEWRQAHSLRAKAHDSGVIRSARLDELAKIETEARHAWMDAADRFEIASHQGRQARRDAEARIIIEQVQVRSRVAELEQQRLELERAVLEQQRRRAAEFEALRQEPRGRVQDQDQDQGLGL